VKERDNTPHADSGECADDEGSEGTRIGNCIAATLTAKDGPGADHARAGIALMAG